MNKRNILIIAGLVALATSWRIINHAYMLAPNLEIVTAVSVIAAITIGWRGAVIVPVVTMAVSDAILGTSPIILFTWSCFALIGASAVILKRLNGHSGRQLIGAAGFAVASSTLFFVVTNFGVWLQGFGFYYPSTLAGLGESYMMGIPFYRTMLIGNLIIVPATVGIWQLIRAYQSTSSKQSVITTTEK